MTNVAILGAGQIGRAAYKIITDLREYSKGKTYINIDAFVVDVSHENISKLAYGSHFMADLYTCTVEELTKLLVDSNTTHVINALPFFLNEKVATAACAAKCSYIDFTEDDSAADRVQEIYKDSNLDCAVKCGLAPGFVNYIGYDLVNMITFPESLTVSVGALPRAVSIDANHPEQSYNLTWSVDGLVNEYIRPCRVKENGMEREITPLSKQVKVIIDGTEYEGAHTSGGVGSLIRDLKDVPNIHYMTLRYPGHYEYIRSVLKATKGDFEKMKQIFLDKFPFTNDDVIVVYSTATGKSADNVSLRMSYSNKFYGVDGMTGIQVTTAGSAVAILELMLTGKLKGIVNHSTVKLSDFTSTEAYGNYYKTSK